MINGIGIDTSEAVVKALVIERCKDPKYREIVLDRLIEREMFLNALNDLCAEDYRIRCEGGTKEQKELSKTQCFCGKIKEIFGIGK
jgi:hypothetical protein